MEKYQDVLTIIGPPGLMPIVGGNITVWTFGSSTNATIYSSNNTNSPTSNPLTTDGSGLYSFYAANGRYSLQASAPSLQTTVITDILLSDPIDGLTGGPFLAIDGSSTNVAFGFTSQPNLGLYRAGANELKIAANNLDIVDISPSGISLTSSAALSWADSANPGVGNAVKLFRDAAGILAQRNGASSQTFRIYGSTNVFASFSHNATTAVISSGALQLSASSMGFYGVNTTSRPSGISTISASSGALASTLAMVFNSLGLINCTSVAP